MPKCCLFQWIFFSLKGRYALEENVLTEQMWVLPLISHWEVVTRMLILCGYCLWSGLSRLQGFHSHFVPKMGSGAIRIWGFRFHLRVLDFNGGIHHLRSKVVYCVRKVFLKVILGENWRPQAAGNKNKNLFQSRVNTGKGDLQWLFFN